MPKSNEYEKRLKELAQVDPVSWVHYYQPSLEDCPKPYKLPAHLQRALELAMVHRRLMLLLPADHGKTTDMSVLYPLFRLATDPTRSVRGGLCSSNASLSEGFLHKIKQELESNSLLRQDYPPFTGDNWSAGAIRLKDAQVSPNYNLIAFGAGTSILSRRIDFLVLDDIIGPEDVITKSSRDKTWQWLTEVATNLVGSEGQVIVVGTVQHTDDVYHRISSLKKVYTVVLMDCWNEKTGEVLWPERWPMEALQLRRQEIGDAAFSKRYRNRVLADEEATFPESLVDACCDESLEIPALSDLSEIYMGVDPAIFTIMIIGIDADGVRIPIDIFQKDLIRFPQQVEKIEEYAVRYNPRLIMVETNSYQGVLKEALEARPIGLSLPLKAAFTGKLKADENEGIPALASIVEKRKDGLRIPWKGTTEQRRFKTFVEELKTHPLGKTMDTIMAWWFCERGFRELHTKAPEIIQGANPMKKKEKRGLWIPQAFCQV